MFKIANKPQPYIFGELPYLYDLTACRMYATVFVLFCFFLGYRSKRDVSFN